MNTPKPRNSIVVLFCSDALAIALGAEQVDQPANLSRLMAQHKTGLTTGSVIAVMTLSGENFLWPVRGAA